MKHLILFTLFPARNTIQALGSMGMGLLAVGLGYVVSK